MAQAWKQFEIDTVNYLNHQYGSRATFEGKGGPDSTSSDILVRTKSGNTFYIEAKSRSAQGYQFVLLPDEVSKSFIYSGKLRESRYTRMIQDHMNDHCIYRLV